MKFQKVCLCLIWSFLMRFTAAFAAEDAEVVIEHDKEVISIERSQGKDPQPLPSAVLERLQENELPPDERELWDLLHRNDLRGVKQRIEEIKGVFPNWQPPASLAQILNRSTAGNAGELLESSKFPACEALPKAWMKAEKDARSGHQDKAYGRYLELLRQCPWPEQYATLQKSAMILSIETFLTLLDDASILISKPHQDELELFRYAWSRRQLFAQKDDATTLDPRVMSTITANWQSHNDPEALAGLAWIHSRQGKFDIAAHEFAVASRADPSHVDWRIWLARHALQNGDVEKALQELDRSPPVPRAQAKVITDEIQLSAGWDALQNNHLDKAESALRSLSVETHSSRELTAWLAFRRADYERAASLFHGLYQQTATDSALEGWIRSLTHLSDHRLELLHKDADPRVVNMIDRIRAESDYDTKRFLSAYALDATSHPDLEGINSGQADLGILYRQKSGSSGTGKLSILHQPVLDVSETFSGVDRVQFKASLINLNVGAPSSNCSAVGAKQAGAYSCQPFNYSPIAQVSDAALAEVQWTREGILTPYASLGTTPLNGVVSPLPTFRAGAKEDLGESGTWGIEAFGQSVRDSFLAYTGQRDPYSGRHWGRVERIGGVVNGQLNWTEHWNSAIRLTSAYLTGYNVQQNWMAGGTLDLGYNFKVDGFDYIRLGPRFMYLHYNQDQFYYTFGQGGYFSPDQYTNTALGINLLTHEGERLVASAQGFIGYQTIGNSTTPWYPDGAPAGAQQGRYTRNSSSGLTYDAEVKGGWLISPSCLAFGGGGYRQAYGYQDIVAGFGIRILFDDRKALFSSDLPDGFFQSVF